MQVAKGEHVNSNLKSFTFDLKLKKQAKSKGADCYNSDDNFVVYIPQNLSRTDTVADNSLTLIIKKHGNVQGQEGPEGQELIFKLVNKAKSKGGDKYICETDSGFSIYLPQTISRSDSGIVEKLVIVVQKRKVHKTVNGLIQHVENNCQGCQNGIQLIDLGNSCPYPV